MNKKSLLLLVIPFAISSCNSDSVLPYQYERTSPMVVSSRTYTNFSLEAYYQNEESRSFLFSNETADVSLTINQVLLSEEEYNQRKFLKDETYLTDYLNDNHFTITASIEAYGVSSNLIIRTVKQRVLIYGKTEYPDIYVSCTFFCGRGQFILYKI